MSRYLGDVKLTHHSPDKRDPEFVFYDVTKATMNVYRYDMMYDIFVHFAYRLSLFYCRSVKPAVFDLFLTMAIMVYLGIVYVAVHQFPRVYFLATKISTKAKSS